MILFAAVIVSCFIEYAFTLLLCRGLLKIFNLKVKTRTWRILFSAAKSITKKGLNKMWKDKRWERGRLDSVFYAIKLQSSYDLPALMWFAFGGVPNKFHSNLINYLKI